MYALRQLLPALVALAVACCWTAARGQIVQEMPAVMPVTPETAIVDAAANVLNEIMAAPAQSIPLALLRDAQGIAIVPGMLKGGFVVGVRHGRGVVVVREPNGAWRAPSFITITGGSVGWQIGIQSSDLILVFKTQKSVQGLLTGKFTIGADASAAAGPVGREASAGTDARLTAEIYSYSRTRGLFVGVALDGSVINMDNAATAAYYRGTGMLQPDAPPGQAAGLPESAARLMSTIAAYSQQPEVAGGPQGFAPTALVVPEGAMAPVVAGAQPADAQAIRTRLFESSQQLAKLLDERWRQYLALPAEIYNGAAPSGDAIKSILDRYNAVAANPQYRTLTQRPEFQETLGLLKAYAEMQSANGNATLSLPAPPK